MPREIITTSEAPSSPLYSQAVRAGNHIYVSGTVGVDISTGKLAGESIQEQTHQALANCETILKTAGSGRRIRTERSRRDRRPACTARGFRRLQRGVRPLVPVGSPGALRREARRGASWHPHLHQGNRRHRVIDRRLRGRREGRSLPYARRSPGSSACPPLSTRSSSSATAVRS